MHRCLRTMHGEENSLCRSYSYNYRDCMRSLDGREIGVNVEGINKGDEDDGPDS